MTNQISPREVFNQQLRAYRQSQIIFAAFEINLFGELAKVPADAQTLSEKMNIPQRGLSMLLTALEALGILRSDSGVFQISPDLQSALDPSSDTYLGGLINHELRLSKRWGQLTDSARSGLPAKKSDAPRNPADTEAFVNAMDTIGRDSARQFFDTVKFNGSEKFLDLGGGPGQYITQFAATYPNGQSWLFEQAESVAKARKLAEKRNVTDRVHFITGDLFVDDLGGPYDVIMLSNLIHIYGNEQTAKIFSRCRDHLLSGGRLLVKDFLLNDDGSGTPFNTQFALHMFLSTDTGKCYSAAEIKELFLSTGFKLSNTYAMTEKSFILEGIKK